MGSLKITESRRFRIQAAHRRLFWSFHVRDVGVAGSNPVTPTIDFRSVPDTSVTDYSGHMGNSLALKGFSALVTLPHSWSKNPKS